MAYAQLKVDVRDSGKYITRSIREEGGLPAVVYGNGFDPIAVRLDNKEISLIYNRYSTFISSVFILNIKGKQYRVLVRDYQLHPVTDNLEHIDFQIIPDNVDKMKIKVALFFINSSISPAIKAGGILYIKKRTLNVMCSAKNIRNEIENDVSNLTKGSIFRIGDINFPSEMNPIFYRDDLVAKIIGGKSS